jgi:archaetidylinositol phosphate synthase
VLNNLRNKFDPVFEKLGRGFASLGFGPSFWTWIGLLLSIISAIMFSLHSPAIGVDWYTATVLGGIFLLIAGFFDAIDGAVARVTNRSTPIGGYLDSVIDKVSEVIVFVGIMIGSFTNPVLVLVALSLSLLVSYTRAKGDGLGVDLKGKGIAERAERILIIAILGFIPFQDNMSVALWIIAILSAITVLERLKVVSARLGIPLFSMQTFQDMFKRTHEFEGLSSGTMTSRLNEPPTSLSKLTKNVNDYLDSSGNKKSETSGKFASSTSVSTTTTPPPKPSTTTTPPPKPSTTTTPPPKPSTTTTPPPKPEGQPDQAKAQYLDKTDPNETGRNVAQIVFGQEEEEEERYKKFLAATTQKQKSDTNKNTNNDSSGKLSDSSKKSTDNPDNPSKSDSDHKQ